MKPTLPASSSPWFWAIPAFAAISMLLIGLTGTNQSLFLFLNNALYFQPEAIWINITLYGDAAMVMVLTLPFIQKRPDIVVRTFIAAIVTTLFIHGFKELLTIPRPPSVLAAELFHKLGNQFAATSFPSGHAAAAFTFASMVIFLIDDTRVRSAVIIYAALVSVSRIATGVHWPLDVLGGMLFGWLASWITVRFLSRFKGESLLSQRVVTLILLLAVIHLIFLHDAGDKEARLLEILTPALCFILSLKGLKSLFLDAIIKRVK